jgi:hypothetical protein
MKLNFGVYGAKCAVFHSRLAQFMNVLQPRFPSGTQSSDRRRFRTARLCRFGMRITM